MAVFDLSDIIISVTLLLNAAALVSSKVVVKSIPLQQNEHDHEEEASALMSAEVTTIDNDTEDSVTGSLYSKYSLSEEKEFIFVTKFREILFRLRKWSCILVCFNLVFLFLMIVVFE